MHSYSQFERQKSDYDRRMHAIEFDIKTKFRHFHTQVQLEEDRIIRFVKEMHSNTLTEFDGMRQEFASISGHRNYLEESIQDNGSFLSGQFQDCQAKLSEMSEKSGITHVPELKWKKTKLDVDGICRVFRNNIELTPSIAKAIDCDVNPARFKRTLSNPEVTLDQNYYVNPISSLDTCARTSSCFSPDKSDIESVSLEYVCLWEISISII